MEVFSWKKDKLTKLTLNCFMFLRYAAAAVDLSYV